MTGQAPLFDTLPLLGQSTIEDAIETTEAEQRAEIERAAAAVAAEEEQAERDAESIRAMLTATTATDADARWLTGLGVEAVPALDGDDDAEEELADVELREFAVFNTSRGPIRVHSATCADVARDRKRYGTPEIIRAADQCGIVADFMSDFIEEGCAPEDLDGDFVWVSCCGDLPWEAADKEDSAPEVDLDALQMTPMVRQMVTDLDSRRWHYQTRKGALGKGLTVDIEATALTEFGEQVRAALLAK